MSTQPMRPGVRASLSLEYPMSLGVYDSYDDAQRAVDYLSDHEFPVENVLIVGTDLKQLERVTGRLTRSRILLGGLLSGAWLGLLIGIIFALFDTSGFSWVSVVATVIFGAVFGAVILLTATLGDLAESLIKRDIGIKDMSSWLPGHGGFLDRLDSILPSAAAAYVLYFVFAH